MTFAEDFDQINPATYQDADLKIVHLVETGLVPGIVAMRGIYLQIIESERIKRYWRYLRARYGAYPVA